MKTLSPPEGAGKVLSERYEYQVGGVHLSVDENFVLRRIPRNLKGSPDYDLAAVTERQAVIGNFPAIEENIAATELFEDEASPYARTSFICGPTVNMLINKYAGRKAPARELDIALRPFARIAEESIEDFDFMLSQGEHVPLDILRSDQWVLGRLGEDEVDKPVYIDADMYTTQLAKNERERLKYLNRLCYLQVGSTAAMFASYEYNAKRSQKVFKSAIEVALDFLNDRVNSGDELVPGSLAKVRDITAGMRYRGGTQADMAELIKIRKRVVAATGG